MSNTRPEKISPEQQAILIRLLLNIVEASNRNITETMLALAVLGKYIYQLAPDASVENLFEKIFGKKQYKFAKMPETIQSDLDPDTIYASLKENEVEYRIDLANNLSPDSDAARFSNPSKNIKFFLESNNWNDEKNKQRIQTGQTNLLIKIGELQKKTTEKNRKNLIKNFWDNKRPKETIINTNYDYIIDIASEATTKDSEGNLSKYCHLASTFVTDMLEIDNKNTPTQLDQQEITSAIQLVKQIFVEDSTSTKGKDKQEDYRVLAGQYITDPKNKVYSNKTLQNHRNELRANPLLKAENPSFFGSKKLHNIYKIIDKASNNNPYSDIICEALDLKLQKNETLEAYLDRATILLDEKYLISAATDKFSIETPKFAKAILAILEAPIKPTPFSAENLTNRLKHLIKYKKPLTPDNNGIFSFGPLSMPAKNKELSLFDEKNNFKYKLYHTLCKQQFDIIIKQLTGIDLSQKKEAIARIVCHTLLKIQTQPIPGPPNIVADAIAKQLCETAAGKEFKILKDSGAIKEEKLSQLYFSARHNVNLLKSKNTKSENQLIQDFLNIIQTQPSTTSHSFTLYRPCYEADGILAIQDLAKKETEPKDFFIAAKTIAQGRLDRWAWRDPETTKIYEALVNSTSLNDTINKLNQDNPERKVSMSG